MSETLQFCLQKGAHKYLRDVIFPMLFGIEPVSWLLYRALHSNIQTRIGFGVEFNVRHIKYCCIAAINILSHPLFISLGRMALNKFFQGLQ